MKTILITGATGFIGRHVLNSLQKNTHYNNSNIVLLSSTPIEGYLTILHKDYTYSKEDFILQGISKIDIIIHIGAYTPKSSAAANNLEGCNSNISSLIHLIKELPSKPDQFIFLSTLDVYKEQTDEIISEDTLAQPAGLYGWSKLYGEKTLEAWARQEHILIQILRLGHIYGIGEEHYQKLIPITIKKVLEKTSPEIYSDGMELRSFLHASDCANAILSSLDLKEYVGPINVVSGKGLSVMQIVNTIVQKINASLPIIIHNNGSPVKSFVFDNRKMNKYLGREVVSFEEGITEEIDYFKSL